MAKFVFFAVFLAALVAVSVAQGEAAAQRFRDMQCRHEVQENPLDACRQVMDRQLTGRSRVVSIPYQGAVRMRCCQQLQGISRECRCDAIRRMVREYEQTMAPLEGGYHGETTEQQGREFYDETAEPQRQQQQGEGAQKEGEGFYGQTARQEGEGLYGQTARQQQGEGRCRQTAEEEFGETSGRQRRGSVGFPPPRVGSEQKITRVKLTKVRLPTTCQIEPQECSVFFPGKY